MSGMGFDPGGGGGWEDPEPQTTTDVGFSDGAGGQPYGPQHEELLPAADYGSYTALQNQYAPQPEYGPSYDNSYDGGSDQGYDAPGDFYSPTDDAPWQDPTPTWDVGGGGYGDSPQWQPQQESYPTYSDEDWGASAPQGYQQQWGDEQGYVPQNPFRDFSGVADEWGGSRDPGLSPGLVASSAYDVDQWQNNSRMTDQALDGGGFYGIAPHIDTPYGTVNWSPSARNQTELVNPQGEGLLGGNPYGQQSYYSQVEEALPEIRDNFYTANAQPQAENAWNQAYGYQNAARDFYGQQAAATQRYNQGRLAQDNYSQAWHDDQQDQAFVQGQNRQHVQGQQAQGAYSDQFHSNQSDQASFYDMLLQQARNGADLEQLGRQYGLTRGEIMQLYSDSGNTDPGHASWGRNAWVSAHAGDLDGRQFQYENGQGWAGVIQTINETFAQQGYAADYVDRVLAHVPGVTGASQGVYSAVATFLSGEAPGTEDIHGPLLALLQAGGQGAHGITTALYGYQQLQEAGALNVLDQFAATGRPPQEIIRYLQEVGGQRAAQNPTESWFVEQAVNLIVLHAGGELAHGLRGAVDGALTPDLAGDWTTGRAGNAAPDRVGSPASTDPRLGGANAAPARPAVAGIPGGPDRLPGSGAPPVPAGVPDLFVAGAARPREAGPLTGLDRPFAPEHYSDPSSQPGYEPQPAPARPDEWGALLGHVRGRDPIAPTPRAAALAGPAPPGGQWDALLSHVRNADPIRSSSHAASPTVYHGTRAQFGDFRARPADGPVSGIDSLGEGVYFTSSRDQAAFWSRDNAGQVTPQSRVIEAQLGLQNPLELNIRDYRQYPDIFNVDRSQIQAAVQARGHDGLIVHLANGETTYVVYDPAHIRQVPKGVEPQPAPGRGGARPPEYAPSGSFRDPGPRPVDPRGRPTNIGEGPRPVGGGDNFRAIEPRGVADVPDGPRYEGRLRVGSPNASAHIGNIDRPANAPFESVGARQGVDTHVGPDPRLPASQRQQVRADYAARAGDDYAGIRSVEGEDAGINPWIAEQHDRAAALADRPVTGGRQINQPYNVVREPGSPARGGGVMPTGREGPRKPGYREKNPYARGETMDFEELQSLPPRERNAAFEAAYQDVRAKVDSYGPKVAENVQRLQQLEVWAPPDAEGHFALIGGEAKRLQDAMRGVKGPEYTKLKDQLAGVNQEIKVLKGHLNKDTRGAYKQLVKDLDTLDYYHQRQAPDRLGMEQADVWRYGLDPEGNEPYTPGHPAGELVPNPLDSPAGKGPHGQVRSEQVAIADEVRRGLDDPTNYDFSLTADEVAQRRKEAAHEAQQAFDIGERGGGARGYRAGEPAPGNVVPGGDKVPQGYDRMNPPDPRPGESGFPDSPRGPQPRLADRVGLKNTVNKAIEAARSGSKDAAFGLAAANPATLQVNEDDDDWTKRVKYAAMILGGAGAAYAVVNRSGVIRKRLGAKAGVNEYPDLNLVTRKVHPKDVQRTITARAAQGYLQTRALPWFEALGEGRLGLGDIVKRTEDLIDGKGSAFTARTTRQSLLDQQMGNLWRDIGDEVKKKLPSAANESFGSADLYTARLASIINDELAKPGRIGASRPVPFAGATNAVKGAMANTLLKLSPAWVVEQHIDRIGHTQIARVLDQFGKEARDGAAGKVLAGLDRHDSGWVADPYLDLEGGKTYADEGAGGGLFDNPVSRKVGAHVSHWEGVGKRDVFAAEAAGYLNTAMAGELGTRQTRWSVLEFVGGDRPLAGEATGRLAHLPEGVRNSLDGIVDRAEFVDTLKASGVSRAQMREALDVFDSHQADANHYGYVETRSHLRDYDYKTNLDRALGVVFPFHYWGTHNLAFVAKFASKHPLPALGIAAAAIYTAHENRHLPNYQKGSVRVPARWLAGQLPASQRAAALEALDTAFGAGQDPRLNLWAFSNPFIPDLTKVIDKGDWKDLKDHFGNPSNLATLTETLRGFGYHEAPQFQILERLLQQKGGLPAWLDQISKEPYQPLSPTGSQGKMADIIAEIAGHAGLLHGFDQLLLGPGQSQADQQGLKADPKGYWTRQLIQEGLYTVGLKPVGTDPAQKSTAGKRAADPNDMPPGPLPKNKSQQRFFDQHGDPPPENTPESDAYWAKNGAAYRALVEGKEPDVPMDAPTARIRYGKEQIKAARERLDAGLSSDDNWTKTAAFDELAQVYDKYGVQRDWETYPKKPVSGKGATLGSNAVGYQINEGVGNDVNDIKAQLADMDPIERWDFLHQPVDEHGRTRLDQINQYGQQFKNYKPYNAGLDPESGTTYGLTVRQLAAYNAEVQKLGPYIPAGQPGSTPQTRAAWVAASDKLKAKYGWQPEGSVDPTGGAPSSVSTVPSAAKPSASSPVRSGASGISVPAKTGATSTYVPNKYPPKAPSAYVPNKYPPKSASTSPSSTTASSSRPGTAPKPTAKANPWRDFIAKASGSPASSPTAPAKPLESGLSAKDVAARYNDWDTREKAGKADIAEAADLILKHEKSGGNPAPYLKRLKFSVYQAVTNFRGDTRQAGDKQRGQWFVEVKALPDETKSLAALVRIYNAAKPKKPVAGQNPASSAKVTPTSVASPPGA